jgi:hypothetical protein
MSSAIRSDLHAKHVVPWVSLATGFPMKCGGFLKDRIFLRKETRKRSAIIRRGMASGAIYIPVNIIRNPGLPLRVDLYVGRY